LAGLRKVGIEPLAFTDNNSALWGTEIQGVKVLSLTEAAEKYGQNAVFVITIWRGEATETMAERKKQLLDINCKRIVPFNFLFWKYPDIFLPHYALDLPSKVLEQAEKVKKCYSLWTDDVSRNEYISQLKWRLLGDFDGLPAPVKHEIYFPDDLFTFMPKELFVDCGAYDGDTINNLMKLHRSFNGEIVAFEPDPTNFKNLGNFVTKNFHNEKPKVDIYPFAVGAQKSKVMFEASGTESSFVGSGTLEVDCVAIDDILANRKPTFIKMDIEGSELDALNGAKRSIMKDLPVLAICSYHHQDHLWRIPTLIDSFSDQYRFFLRPHLFEVWDLVCYAIPEKRLLSAS
jgi:FkbM family methyltransferase